MTRVYWTEVHTGWGRVLAGRSWSRKRDAERDFRGTVEILNPGTQAYLKVREPDGSVHALASFPNAEEGK